MVKLIMGLKGSGKTKQMIEMVKQAVEEEHGDVVCLEKGPKLTYDIPHKARLISTTQYNFGSFEFLKGFISGLNASNYDISHIFIDSLQKIIDDESESVVSAFLDWLSAFSERENINFTITYSADPALFGEGVKKYL
ncbi:MAG: ATP-binding protein [Oscillospiraceae bacterium]|nr:ATP-binding protein [Oscillospiraceae bacterium]